MTKLTPDQLKAQLRCQSITDLRDISKWLAHISDAGELAVTVQSHGVKGAAIRLGMKPGAIYQRLWRAGVSTVSMR